MPVMQKDANGVRMKAMFDLIPCGEDWKCGGQYIQQVLGELGIKVNYGTKTCQLG